MTRWPRRRPNSPLIMRCAAPTRSTSLWLVSTTVRLSRSTASSASVPRPLSPPARRLRLSRSFNHHRQLRDLPLCGSHPLLVYQDIEASAGEPFVGSSFCTERVERLRRAYEEF